MIDGFQVNGSDLRNQKQASVRAVILKITARFRLGDPDLRSLLHDSHMFYYFRGLSDVQEI